jgi:hypothetical protein
MSEVSVWDPLPVTLGSVALGVPLLWDTNKGPMGRFPSNFQGAVPWKPGYYVAVDTSGNLWRLRPGENWTQVSASALAGTLVMLFVDSRGYVYYSTSTGAAIGNLWRFTDFFTTAGTSTATALVAFPDAANDYSCPMCEDDLGNVYTGTYHQLTAGSGARRVYKIDPQDNVIDITANYGGESAVNRHIHGIWWDKFRRLLFVTHGDAGTASRIFVSDDYGATFSTWAVSAQSTAMAFTPDTIIVFSDGAVRDIRRITNVRGATKAQVMAKTPVQCFDPRSLLGYGITTTDSSTTTGTGFAWHAHVFPSPSGKNIVMFPITTSSTDGKRPLLMASSDDGATWVELLGPRYDGSKFMSDFCKCSDYAAGDGFLYGTDTTAANAARRVRLLCGGDTLSVGGSDEFADGVSAPMKLVTDTLRNAGARVRQKLLAAVAGQVGLEAPGLIIDTNALGLVQSAVTPSFSDGGETADPYTHTGNSASATFTYGATDFVRPGGTKSVKMAIANSAGSDQAFFWRLMGGGDFGRVTVDGDEVWMTCFMRFDGSVVGSTVAGFPIGTFDIFRWTNGPTLAINSSVAGIFLQAFSASKANTLGQGAHKVPLVLQSMVKVTMRVRIAPATGGTVQGRITVWQDDRLIIDVVGVGTRSGSQLTNATFGWLLGGSAVGINLTQWVDDVAIGLNGDPDVASTRLLRGVSQSMVKEAVYT